MKSRLYKWLLFDADGTLFDYDECERRAFTNTIHQAALPYEVRYLEAYRSINAALWLEREQGKIDIERLKIKRFESLFETVDIAADPQKFNAWYLENLAEEAVLLDHAAETIRKLSGIYKLALVTNGLQEVQYRRLSKSTLDRYFDVVIVSGEIGVSKPGVEFFEITFGQLGNPEKSEVLIIGDSLTSDMQGANNYGIDACWFNPAGTKRPQGLRIVYEVQNLLELMVILSP